MQAAATYLRTLREAQGMTQEQLAARLDVAAKTIHNIERGKSDPRSSMLHAILRAVQGKAETVHTLMDGACDDPDYGRELAEHELAMARLRSEFGDEVYQAALKAQQG
jgi:transcriptional regulator with XRE-family HTH domain